MNVQRIVRLTLAVATLLIGPSLAAAGGLDSFLEELDLRAKMDIGSYKADLSVIFDVSDREVSGMLEVMSKPSDVYMCLRVGELAEQPVGRVLEEYQRHEGQGWGVIAKNLGIKPGSAAFHALKADRLGLHGDSAASGKTKQGGRGRK